MKQKIGFLFLDTIAHVYHAAPTAFELSKNPHFEVILFVSTKENHQLLQEISSLYPNHQCCFIHVKPSWIHQLADFFKKRPFPKIAHVQKNHLKDFLSCQAWVSTDKNMHVLNDHNKEGKIKTFCLHHGPAHRDYVLSKEFALFDCNLLGGNAAYQYMFQSGIFSKEQLRVVGYPKFDIALKGSPKKLFKNNLPTVLYNPHDDPKISSWHHWGIDILEYFYNSSSFNLIFAPHIQLFGKQKIYLPEKYKRADHIHIDTGSRSSCDMTYTRGADIYLGDMSSQYFEFLVQPRPCVFLNAGGKEWENDFQYRAWHLGDVVSTLDALENTLKKAHERHPFYSEKQKEIINDVFFINDEPAAKRAARAIEELL